MKYLLIPLFVLSALHCSSQVGQAGIHIYAGISNATNKDALVTPEGTTHPGFLIGADARLNSGNMYFLVGGQYHSLDYLAQTEKSYLSIDEKMAWLKLRIGLGFNLFNFSEKIAIRAKALGGINVISSYPSTLDAPYRDDGYNTGTAGATLGLGIDVYNITLDVEYEKGIFNAVNKVKGTEFDFLMMTMGFFF